MYMFWEGRLVDALLSRLGVARDALRIAYRHRCNPHTLAAEVLDAYGWQFVAAHKAHDNAPALAWPPTAHYSRLMPTQAHVVSERLGYDGHCYNANGVTLDAMARAAGALVSHHAQHPDWLKYVFPDKSIIVDYGPYWDIGYPDCWCMAGVGHRKECEA